MKLQWAKFLWKEGVKKHLIAPSLKWFGILIGGYGCYDYGKYESIINPVDPAVKETVEVIFLTKFQNLIKWILDGRVMEFIIISVNNISKYLQIPFYIVTSGLILLSILLLFVLIKYLYRIMFQKTDEVTNKLFNIYEETLYKHLDKQIAEVSSQEENKIIAELKQSKQNLNLKLIEMQKQIEKEKKEIVNLNKSLQEGVKNSKDLEKLQEDLNKEKLLNKNLKKQITNKQKIVKDLQNKLKKTKVVKGKRGNTGVKKDLSFIV